MIIGVATNHIVTPSVFRPLNAVMDMLILFNGMRVDGKECGRVFKVETGEPDPTTKVGEQAGIYRYILDEEGKIKVFRNEQGIEVLEYEFVPGKVEVFLRLKEGDLRSYDVVPRNPFRIARLAKHPADAVFEDGERSTQSGPAGSCCGDAGGSGPGNCLGHDPDHPAVCTCKPDGIIRDCPAHGRGYIAVT